MNINILLLEDDLAIASGLTYALEKEGYVPSHYKSIKEVMPVAREEEFHLAILDMQLPDGNGKAVGEVLLKRGIPKEQLASLFRKFENSQNENGYGIGLPLALSIIREQDGDIEVVSGGNGEGAIFIVKFFR